MANILNSNIALSGWLGMLFINVFGTWEGSFGIDTSAGNPPASPSDNTSVPKNVPDTIAVTSVSGRQQEQSSEPTPQINQKENEQEVLPAAAQVGPDTIEQKPVNSSNLSSLGVILGGALFALALAAIERNRRARKNSTDI